MGVANQLKPVEFIHFSNDSTATGILQGKAESKMSDEKSSEVRTCEHCGNRAPMQIVANYERDESEDFFQAWTSFETLLCPSCEKVILRRVDRDDTMFPGDGPSRLTLYPDARVVPDGLPETIEKAYLSARRVRNVEANAYGVLIGRLLQLVCEEQDANGKDLFAKLSDLSKKQIIPKNLSDVAQRLRDFRNIGAHADLGELTESQVPLLDKLVQAVLQYVYTAPFLANQARSELGNLKAKTNEK